jgi:hypothetical protein
MKKHIGAILLGSTAITLTGCDTFRNTFGLDHYQADEFNVSDNPPLSMPPNYNLAPPANNSSENTEKKKADDENTTKKAKEALLGRAEKTKNTTTNSGKVVVEKASEVQKADPEIRKTVTAEKESLSSDSDSFSNKLAKIGDEIAKNAKNTSVPDKKEKDLLSAANEKTEQSSS